MKGRPRITYVIPSMRVGGTELQLLHLMRGLADDFELSLICTGSEGALIGDARRVGAYVRVLHGHSGWDFRMRGKIYWILQAHPAQILHSFMFGFDLWAHLAARKAGVPVIVSSRRELAIWQKPRHRYLQCRANRMADCIVANSQAVAAYVAAQEGEPLARIRVIPNGVRADDYHGTIDRDQLRARYRFPRTGHIVGMVANFSPVKDHRLFLDMADLLLKRREDIHFLLVGTGRLLDEIHEIVSKRKQLSFFTRVSTVSEMADLLRIMDVSVLCSKMEGFPNAAIEAMASGTPVVAAAVGGVPELVEDRETGYLIGTRRAEDFADAVEQLLDDEGARQAMGARAEAWVRAKLPVERMVERYRKLYHELLETKTAGVG